jgi:hypothetical protein
MAAAANPEMINARMLSLFTVEISCFTINALRDKNGRVD